MRRRSASRLVCSASLASARLQHPTASYACCASWRRSEGKAIGDLVALSDSKRPEQAPLVYTRDEISTMSAGARTDAFGYLT
ncbi:hypothetical protein [Streptomyces sp. NPDC088757]|uniref:hypothetical protein n=1 Tax=Streptomyces sp. NPDC088757 TaxID=3365889 RepID=UPI0037FAC529